MEKTKTNYSVRRFESNGVQTAEIFDTVNNNLDYVVMFFKSTKENISEIENKIGEYRKNPDTCIIGCINSLEEGNLSSLFDVHLNDAADLDFEKLIDFCISTEASVVHVSQHDFKSQPGTEIHVITVQSQSLEELTAKLKSASQKILDSENEKKFPKAVVSLMTNGRNLLLTEVEEILKAITKYLTEDYECMWNSCESMEGLKEDEVKVTVIFFDRCYQ